MKYIKLSTILIAFICFAMQCKKEEVQQIPAEIELYGTISDKQTNLPLSGVIVQLSRQANFYVFSVAETHTDTLGKYDLKFQPDNSSGYFLGFTKAYYAGEPRYIDSYKAKQEFNLQLLRDSTNWVNKK